MRRLIPLLLVLFLLTACSNGEHTAEKLNMVPSFASEQSEQTDPIPLDSAPTSEATLPSSLAEPATVPSEPMIPPSEASLPQFYLPGVTVDDVIVYFREICLDSEYYSDGNPTVVQKWVEPIYYKLLGSYTQEDLTIFSDFCDTLNQLDGFPGIFPADNATGSNLSVHFCAEDEMVDLLGNDFWGMDGGVTFWYADDEIYEAIICCRMDIDQYTRNSVIMEELYNALGPVQDTSLREDSLVFAGFSTPQAMTQVDALLLQLLYHPMITCGMDAEECEAVIRQLYGIEVNDAIY